MSKQQLYIVIALLGAVVLYLLFVPATTPAPATPSDMVDVVSESDSMLDAESGSEAPTDPEPEPVVDEVVIEGLFLGLAEEETDFRQSFYYLLLDDGTEVVSIDLRPLLGYSTTDVIEKLGVDRGVRVRITGSMTDDGFKIASITAAE